MPLTHVVHRTAEGDWEPISADEAAIIHPHGSSHHSKEFLCEICMQDTRLMAGGKKANHFKHPIGSSDCDEKSTSWYNSYHQTNPLSFSLPLFIGIQNNQISARIGFPPIETKDMEKAIALRAKIRIDDNRIYSIDEDRFSTEHYTYLEVGSAFKETYTISFTPATAADIVSKYRWPRVIDGFNPSGTVFDKRTGRRLAPKSTAMAGKDYCIISKGYLSTKQDIRLERLFHVSSKSGYNPWTVYNLKAIRQSPAAIDFFLRFQLFLEDKPSVVSLLWPVAIQDYNLLRYIALQTYFYKTTGFVSVHPYAFCSQSYTDGFFSVKTAFQQILSISRFRNNVSVQKTLMLRREPNLSPIIEPHPARIVDGDGVELDARVHSKLPRGKKMLVKLDFDGYCVELTNGFVSWRGELKAGMTVPIEVKQNRTYHVFQGRDLVFEATFSRDKGSGIDDESLLKHLRRFTGKPMRIDHSAGGMAALFKDAPKTKLWLRQQIHQGTIDREAYRYLLDLGRK